MALWIPWCNAIWQLRPAFSRLRTFLWFATAVAGFTVRTELLGVTSLVRAQPQRPLLQQAGRSLSQPRRQARPARRAVDPDRAAAIPAAAAHQRALCRGRRRHQSVKAQP
jgi:hypothetical protein